MRRGAVVAGLIASSCGLFPDLSNLDDGGDAAANDAAPVDAPLQQDAPPQDAAIDSPNDSADAGFDAAESGFCATHQNHAFCEDFDEPNFATRWNGVVVNTGGAAGESDASFVSAPNQLLATTSQAGGGGTAYAYKHFASAKTFKVQVQLFVEPTAYGNFDPLIVVFTPAPAGYTYYNIHIDTSTLHLGCSSTPLDAGNTTKDYSFTTSLAAWHNVELDFDTTTSTATVLVDGALSAQGQFAPLTASSSFDVRVGIASAASPANNAATGAVHADNVLVDTQ